MSTMVRMPVELKEKLAEMQEQFRCKTMYEVIEKLIEIKDRQQIKISELEKQKQRDKELIENEYIYLGIETKNELAGVMKDIGICNHGEMVEILAANFEGMSNVSKFCFFKYVEIQNRNRTE